MIQEFQKEKEEGRACIVNISPRPPVPFYIQNSKFGQNKGEVRVHPLLVELNWQMCHGPGTVSLLLSNIGHGRNGNLRQPYQR